MPDGRLRCVASLPFSLVVPSCSRNLSSFGTELDDAVRVALDDVDVAVPVDAARVLPRRVDRLAVDLLIGAGQDQVAVAVEHHHRLGAAVEDVDVILLRRWRGRRCPAGSSGRRPFALPPPAAAHRARARAAACASRSAGGGGASFSPKYMPAGSFGQFGTSR